MAEKRAANNAYQTIMADMKAGKYAPVYLLMGDEPYFIDCIADYIAENAIKPEERDFNQTILYGLDTTPVQIMDAAHAAPMMAEHQVIIVREAQLLKGVEQLEKYFNRPVSSTILVVCYKKEMPKSKKGWIEEAEKNGVLFESKKYRDYQLPDFVREYLKARRVDIEDKAVSMIADHIGPDLARLASELDKLILSLSDDNRRVVPEFVEKQIGISKDYNPYELRDAIIRKDVVKANRIVKYFDNNPKAGNLHTIVPALFSYFQNLLIAYYCPNRQNENELASWLGLRGGWAAREYMVGMHNYSGVKAMQIIQLLRVTAAKSNGLDNRSASEGELMQELVYNILH